MRGGSEATSTLTVSPEGLAALPVLAAGDAHTLELPPETPPRAAAFLTRPAAQPGGFNPGLLSPTCNKRSTIIEDSIFYPILISAKVGFCNTF